MDGSSLRTDSGAGATVDLDVAVAACETFVGLEWVREQGAGGVVVSSSTAAGAGAGAGSGAGAGAGSGAGTAGATRDGHAHPYASVSEFLRDYPLETLFGMMGMKPISLGQLASVCAAVERVMMSPECDALLSAVETRQYLVLGMQHPQTVVRRLTATVLRKRFCGPSNSARFPVLCHESVFEVAVPLLGDKVEHVALQISDVIVETAKHCDAAFLPVLIHCVKAFSDTRVESVARARILAVTSGVASQSSTALHLCIRAGLMDAFEDVFESDDVLMQLNAVELLAPIASTADGARHLLTGGVIEKLLHLAGVAGLDDDAEDDLPDPDAFVGDQALAAVCQMIKLASGAAGGLHTEVAALRDVVVANVLRTVEAHLAGSDVGRSIAALRALVDLCCSGSSVLSTVLARASLMREWLELGESNTMPLRVGCYHAVARAVEAATAVEGAAAARSHTAGSGSCGAHDGTAAREGEAAEAACGAGDAATAGRTASAGADSNGKPAAQRVFEGLGQACGDVTMAVLMRALRQPFEELRVAVFDVLQAAARHPAGWGVRAVVGHAGMAEFLLNADTEPSKECTEKKHAVLQAIATSAAAPSILGADLGARLAKAAMSGPFRPRGAGPKKPDEQQVATMTS